MHLLLKFDFQIIHLKRFQFLNGRWVKSQKIVKFPFKDFNPSSYLVQRVPPEPTTSESDSKLSDANECTNHNTNASESSDSGIENNTPGSKITNNNDSEHQMSDQQPVMNGGTKCHWWFLRNLTK